MIKCDWKSTLFCKKDYFDAGQTFFLQMILAKAVLLTALVLLWLLDALESERGNPTCSKPCYVGPTLCSSCNSSIPSVYTKPLSFHIDAHDPYRRRGRLPVLEEVEDDDDRYGSGSLLDESDLSALAEASMKLEELEETVGRILFQVECEQNQLEGGLVIQDNHKKDFICSEFPDSHSVNLDYLEDYCNFSGRHGSPANEIDRYSKDLDEQLNDLERCARAYGEGINSLGCKAESDIFGSSETENICLPCGSCRLSGSFYDDCSPSDLTDDEYAAINDCSEESEDEGSLLDLQHIAIQYEQDLLDDAMHGAASFYPCCPQHGDRQPDRAEQFAQYDRTISPFHFFGTSSNEEDRYSEQLSQLLNISNCSFSNVDIPSLVDNSTPFLPSYLRLEDSPADYYEEGSDSSDTYDEAMGCAQSCSLEDLEKCIDKLVLDVEREEARLRQHVQDKFMARRARFSMPMPPRPLSEVPRETLQGRASSMDSLLRPYQGSDIWWEGAYRNITRTPDGQEESGSESKDESRQDSEQDTDFEERPLRAQIMLLVRTTELGKDTVEIRSMCHVDSDSNNDGSQCFSRGFATSLTDNFPLSPPGTPRVQRLYIHSPHVRELRSFSLEDLTRPAVDVRDVSTLPRRRRHGSPTDPFPLEFSPPPSLVQYVVPVGSQPPDVPPSPSPTPVEYVTHLPGPTPGRGYCTWLPNPSPRGKASSTHSMPHPREPVLREKPLPSHGCVLTTHIFNFPCVDYGE